MKKFIVEAKPCPFCCCIGTSYVYNRKYIYIVCGHCGARTKGVHADKQGKGAKKVLELWNTRL